MLVLGTVWAAVWYCTMDFRVWSRDTVEFWVLRVSIVEIVKGLSYYGFANWDILLLEVKK